MIAFFMLGSVISSLLNKGDWWWISSNCFIHLNSQNFFHWFWFSELHFIGQAISCLWLCNWVNIRFYKVLWNVGYSANFTYQPNKTEYFYCCIKLIAKSHICQRKCSLKTWMTKILLHVVWFCLYIHNYNNHKNYPSVCTLIVMVCFDLFLNQQV